MSRSFPSTFGLAGYPGWSFRVHPTSVGPWLKLQCHMNNRWVDLNAAPVHQDDLARRVLDIPTPPVVNADEVER